MGHIRKLEVTPTISTLIYAAGDAVGGLMEFPFAIGYPGKTGRIVGIEIVDKAAQAAAMTLQLFDRTFTPTADNAAYAPSDADAANAVGNIAVAAADYAGGTLNKIATKGDLSIPFQLPSNGTSLFGQLFTQGTPTYASASDLIVKLFVEEA